MVLSLLVPNQGYQDFNKYFDIFFFFLHFYNFLRPKCTTFWKPNSKRYFQANVRTENLGLFMHKGDAAGFRQILAPGPSLRKSLPVFMSECGASWMMKPRGVAVIGSQCQKAPAFVRDGGHMGRGRAAHPEAAVRPPRFAVHLCQL